LLRPPPRSPLFPYTTLFRSLKTDSLIVLRQYWPAVARLPASAFVELEDVAGVVLFLCTDAARGIRGQHIVVDNGLSNEMLLGARSEEHTSELQSRSDLVCRL